MKLIDRRIFSIVLICLVTLLTIVYYDFKTLLSVGSKIAELFQYDLNSNQTTVEVLIADSRNESLFVTVVGIYMSFNKSKHSVDKYQKWMDNILVSCQAPMVIYTDKASMEVMASRRAKLKLKTFFLVYDDIWQLMNELEKERGVSYTNKYKMEQKDKDPERNIHNPDLYAVWNLKPYMLDRAAKLNPFNSNLFIYSDMGAWRQGTIPNWPDVNFLKLVYNKFELSDNRMLFAQVYQLGSQFEPTQNLVEGGFYAGSPKAIEHFKRTFYDLHDFRMFNQSLFIGKDQTMINMFVFGHGKNGEREKSVLLKAWMCSGCNFMLNEHRTRGYDVWFAYQYFLAHNESYSCSYSDRLKMLVSI